MRFSATLATTALLLAAAPQFAGAQKATATAQVGTVVPQQGPTIICDQAGGPGLSANATCGPMNVKGGTAGATATSNLLARTATAGVGMLDKGPPGLVAFAEAQSRVTAKIAVNGTVDAGDYIVLHFLAGLDWEFSGRPADAFTALITAAHGEGDAGASFFSDVHTGNHGGSSSGTGAQRVQGGFDLTLAFDNFTGLYKYTYGVGLAMGVDDTDATLAWAQFGIRLRGIDAYNANDEYRGSVEFFDDGTETLDLQSTAPEPATIALVATGLAGILGASRRRKKARR